MPQSEDLKPTSFDKDVLLQWFFYNLPWDEKQNINRAKLIRELPAAYNRYVGQPVGRVVNYEGIDF